MSAFDIRSSGLDSKTERELARKVSEAENAARVAVERERRIIAERQAELEARVACKERELVGIKESALDLQEEVSTARRAGGPENQSIVEVWPELEEVTRSLHETQSKLHATTQRGIENSEASQDQLDVDRGVFQMYAAATGIRWEHDSENVEGYVALNGARHFCISKPSDGEKDADAEDDLRGKAARAEALWEEVEACLGLPAADTDRPPWEAVGGA